MIKYISKDQPQYKANLHCHSTLSDGKLTPEQLKTAYKDKGYSVLAITDHEYPYDHTAMSESDFLMLTGYEAYIRPDGKYNQYGSEVHINLFAKDPHNVDYVCWNENYCKYAKGADVREAFNKVGSQREREYSVEYINDFVKTAKENGYICAHNHAVWSLEPNEMLHRYEGFFSMEMCNYSAFRDSRIEYNAPLYEELLREGKRLFVHSADDNHNDAPLDSPYSDSFGGFTMILSKDLTYGAIIEALEKGDFYSSMGPKIHELTFDGSHVHMETDPVRQITMRTAGKRSYTVTGTEDSPVTSADFEIPETTAFIRFSAYDFQGRYADTRGFFRDELGI